ncbi:GAF domain-containing protein [Paenibacillus paeoniae]|uniref:GAF domain-containing protein n=1 Tax=Paenibacillus paeoniae TaxID=2292705 RepID=A0A371PF82_9BACL|nr:GAF domain-containing protein [Paenibacillus paeoniae]REK74597.1 GAF domain-containing protein [Paenibacillus paeoniae]
MNGKAMDEAASELLQLLLMDTDSDLAAIGEGDLASRKLRWIYVAGGTSVRTELIRQRMSLGLSGSALRSGRIIKLEGGLSDNDFFKLGEAIVLTEGLRAAAALPLQPPKERALVIFIGRRRDESYSDAALMRADEIGMLLSGWWDS